MYNENLDDLIVIKRSGQRVMFNASKVAIAIKKSFDSIDNDIDDKEIFKVFEKVLTIINNDYKERKTINVEDIQDVIENTLKEMNYENIYLSFSDYRKKRAASRLVFNEKQQHKFVKSIEKVSERNKFEENAISPNATIKKFGRIIASEYTKSYVLDNKYLKAIEEGNLYLHSLDYFNLGIMQSLNIKCGSDDIDEIIRNIINASSEISSNIGICELDYKLEKIVINEYHNILKNNLKKYFKASGLLEFITIRKFYEIIDKEKTINLDMFTDLYVNDNVKLMCKYTLEDSTNEIKEYINIIVDKLFNSIKNNKINYNFSLSDNESVFGLLIKKAIINYLNISVLNNIYINFRIYDGIDSEYKDGIIGLIINNKKVSLSFNSNYNNLETSYFMDGTRINENTNLDKYFGEGREIISSSSINLARLGLKFKDKDINLFYDELIQNLDLVKNELLLEFETIGNKMSDSYEYLFKGNIYDDEKLDGNQKIRKVIKNGVLNIGLIGLKECTILLSKENEYEDFVINILKLINEKITKYSEESKVTFALFESTDLKARKYLMGIDKSIYGVIKGINDKDYYDLITNLKCFDDLNKIGMLQSYFKGGLYFEKKLPSSTSLKKIDSLISDAENNNIGFIKIVVGKNEG